MKLWGGRFTKETDQLVHNFNESLSFDQKFYHQDIEGSIAHVKMLEKQGILSTEDRDDIIVTESTFAAPSTSPLLPVAAKDEVER